MLEEGLDTQESRRHFQCAYGINDGINPVQETSGTTVLANILTGLGIDEFFSRTDVAAATTSHFLSDALGSTVGLADSAGVVQSEYTYEPFGKTTTSGFLNSNPFQYTGRENDGTGLYYYRARYYHPSLQRFLSEDPIEFEGEDINLYAYVWNAPLDFIDPSGEAMTIPLPGPCRRNPPPPDNGSKSSPDPEPDDGNPILEALRGFACDPANWIPMPGMAKGPKYRRPPWEPKKPPHTSRARPSTTYKHEEGLSRQRRDQGDEKGDARRRPYK